MSSRHISGAAGSRRKANDWPFMEDGVLLHRGGSLQSHLRQVPIVELVLGSDPDTTVGNWVNPASSLP